MLLVKYQTSFIFYIPCVLFVFKSSLGALGGFLNIRAETVESSPDLLSVKLADAIGAKQEVSFTAD